MTDRQEDQRDSRTERRHAGEAMNSDSGGSLSRLRGRRAVAVGLAATSVGALAGMTSTGTAETGSGNPVDAGMDARDAVVDFVVSEDWDITPAKNDQVDFFIEFLMGKNHDKTKLWLERIGKFGPMVQQKLDARGMPHDLLWLSMIESGFDPNAYSSADAAGLWQFIAPTGERYGLEVSKYVDERRDPEKATDAALDYLQELHDRFGSWYLAAASYNTGENRVGRVMRQHTGAEKGSDADFWAISKDLPSETRDYVPVMLAAGHIGKDPGKYGFSDLKPQEAYSYDEVLVPGGVQLSDVAEAAGVGAETVYDLNPQLVKKQTPPSRDWMVRIPTGSKAQFQANWKTLNS